MNYYFMEWNITSVVGLCLVLASCSTVNDTAIREKQNTTVRVIGMSVLPFPSGVALGYRLSNQNTVEWESTADILTLNSYTALFNKHYWGSYYINTGISAARSIMRNQDPYRAGLHLALGREFYYGPKFFGGFELATVDYGFYKKDGNMKESGGGNLLRFYLGWGW